jgi:peroxiredoxin
VEFPKLQETYEATKSKDFELVAINLGQPAQVSEKFRQDFSATFPMLVDNKNIMQSLYGIKVYPTNVFINPEGKIVRVIRGWISQKQVEVLIAQHKK